MSIWEKLGFGGYKGFSHESDQLLRSAVELAGNLGCEKADTGHLLLAILQQDHGAAARFLEGKQRRHTVVTDRDDLVLLVDDTSADLCVIVFAALGGK